MTTSSLILLATSLALAVVRAAEGIAPEPELMFGGCGGVYFLAEPGELELEVFKRDARRGGRHTELRAILVGPDRRVRQEVAIPDSGTGSAPAPLQRAKLTTQVDRKGVYALNITVSQDRYGDHMAWGFRTNCPHYLVETARGHRDERHREPIVLAGADRPARVCFMPRPTPFRIGVTGLPSASGTLELLDSKGALIREIAVAEGSADCALPAGLHRDKVPWCLQLPTGRATISIDGVTQWDKGDPYQDLCVWTPTPQSWFPLLEHRWLLTPYSRSVCGKPGTGRQIPFRVHNNAPHEKAVRLSLEFPDDRWKAGLTTQRVVLAPGAEQQVGVMLSVPPQGGTVHLRATPEDAPEFTTYSTLTVTPGDAPPIGMPMQLRPYQHENGLFAYLPDYPTGSQPYFDHENRPFMVSDGQLVSLRDGSWITNRVPGSPSTTKIAFDRDGTAYLIARTGAKASLLRSMNGGRTFETFEIPGRPATFDIEQFSGHNVPDGPPPFVRFTRTSSDPKLRWRSINDLELFVPRRSDAGIETGEPILISRACIGLSAHSGIPSSVVSRGSKVHVAWGEATDPDDKAPGVPTYVVTYDRGTGTLGRPALIGHGPPANDVHNSPGITIDSKGFLHVLIGTHGRPFQYACSKQANDAGGGWTAPVTTGDNLRPTYIGFVCGRDDALHVVYRLWRTGEPHPHSSHATLAHQRKLPGKPWEPPRILVVAPFSEYSIFYHRLTIDQRGRLFLSKDYWSTYWFYRNDQPGAKGHWRTLLMSPDGGDSWRLASGEDL